MKARVIRFLLGVAVGLVVALPLRAETSGLKRLTLRQDLLGYEAVGRLDLNGKGFCSAALIAPDLVLTAAHCLVDRNGKRRDVAGIVFRAGLRDGEAVAERAGLRAVIHKRYARRGGSDARNIRHDAALVQLAAPIPAATAAPFVVDTPGASGAVSVVSYAQGRERALSRQASCAVRWRDQGLMGFDCDVTFGSSGAPVFDSSGARPRIVSLISSGVQTEAGPMAIGMALPGVVADLKDALRSGEGVFPKRETGAKRLRVGQSGSTGARFVRP